MEERSREQEKATHRKSEPHLLRSLPLHESVDGAPLPSGLGMTASISCPRLERNLLNQNSRNYGLFRTKYHSRVVYGLHGNMFISVSARLKASTDLARYLFATCWLSLYLKNVVHLRRHWTISLHIVMLRYIRD